MIDGHALQQIRRGDQDKQTDKAAIESAPQARAAVPHDSQSDDDHQMLNQREDIKSGIIFGEILGDQLPGQGEVGVQGQPPESEQREIKMTKPHVTARGG